MTSPAPRTSVSAALVLALVTFVATFVAAYPSDLSPLAVATLAGGCALVPTGVAFLLAGQRSVGALIVAGGLVASAVAGAPVIARYLPSTAEQVQGVQDPGPVAPPATSPSTSTTPAATPRSSPTPATVSRSTSTPPPPTHAPSPARRPLGPGHLGIGLGDHAVSRAVPRISAAVSDGYDGAQRVAISLSGLGRSSVEWDLFSPDGSTLLGTSMASPQDAVTYTYDLHPPVTGDYGLQVRNKDTGATSTSSVHLRADPREPYVVERRVLANPGFTVSSIEGRACSGAQVTLHFAGVGTASSARVELNGGEHLEGGLTPDALGSDYLDFAVTAQRCTGRDERVGVVTVTDASDRTLFRGPLSIAN